MGVGEGVGKCIGVWGEMKKDVEKCVGVWEALGEVWESGESTGRDVGCVGGGEEKCLGVNAKSLTKCVRVWIEVWKSVGRGVKKCTGVWDEMRRGVEKCWKRCGKVCWGVRKVA